jgi:hypothetical protein
MLFDAVLAAIVVALVAGGRLSRLAGLELRWTWVFVAAFALQFAIKLLGIRGWQPMAAAAPALHVFSYLLLFAALAANRRLWSLWFVAAGVALNFTAIVANAGAMPVRADLVRAAGQQRLLAAVEAGRFPTHRLLDEHTRLPWLADRYFLPPLPTRFPRSCVFSPGDVFITLGAVLLVLRGMGAFGWGREGKEAGSRK